MSQQNTKPVQDLRSPAGVNGRRMPGREADWIGRKLNQVYNQTLAEPVPAQFMALIEAISASERSAEDSSKS